MPKSPFFSYGSESERRLYENIISESIFVMGENILYLPRTIVNFDILFGEDILSKYQDSYLLEAYQDSHNSGFGDAANVFGKFGIEVKDEAIYTVSKLAFERIVLQNNLETVKRPLEGDLIYSILSSELFQIKFVENEDPYRMFGDVQTYKLHVEVFKYSNQQITADIVENEVNNFSTSLTVTMLVGSGDYVVNEIVTNGNTNGSTTAKVANWDSIKKQLKLIDLNGKIDKNKLIFGATAIWSIDKFKTTQDSNAKFDINEFLQDKSDIIIDLEEKNILGDVVTSNFMDSF